MRKDKDHAWDEDDDTGAYDLKMEEWARRNWAAWLAANLSFPFKAVREDDEDDAFFTDVAEREPFRQGHTMDVIGLDPEEDPDVGFIAHAKEGKHAGQVPLADLEVRPKSDKNYWPVREYAVWFANRK